MDMLNENDFKEYLNSKITFGALKKDNLVFTYNGEFVSLEKNMLELVHDKKIG